MKCCRYRCLQFILVLLGILFSQRLQNTIIKGVSIWEVGRPDVWGDVVVEIIWHPTLSFIASEPDVGSSNNHPLDPCTWCRPPRRDLHLGRQQTLWCNLDVYFSSISVYLVGKEQVNSQSDNGRIFSYFINVIYWPSTEPSIKRCTCVNKWKNSGSVWT